jgi:nicotinamidase/pyrazinamidase
MLTPSAQQGLVFVDIDTQRDFLDPDGALYIPGSHELLPNLSKLTSFASSRSIPIIATACAHTLQSPEFDVFPPHCLLGTSGQERVDATRSSTSLILSMENRVDPAQAIPMHLTIHKDAYDVFERSDVSSIFERYAVLRPTFVVYGVATDYCVKAAVEGLIQRGQPVALVVDAIRAVDPNNEAAILTDFAHRGVLLTLTETIVKTA